MSVERKYTDRLIRLVKLTDLPEEDKQKAIKGIRREQKENSSRPDCVCGLMTWAYTPEGGDFWIQVCRKIEGYGIQDIERQIVGLYEIRISKKYLHVGCQQIEWKVVESLEKYRSLDTHIKRIKLNDHLYAHVNEDNIFITGTYERTISWEQYDQLKALREQARALPYVPKPIKS